MPAVACEVIMLAGPRWRGLDQEMGKGEARGRGGSDVKMHKLRRDTR
jgi:hypothetical protein